MSTRTLKTRLQLRRDTEANFEPIKNSFIPLKGEVLLVDTTSDGLRSKVGDGVKTFAQLSYSDDVVRDLIKDVVVRGYYYNGKFYTTVGHTVEIAPYEHKVYINLASTGYDIYSYFTSESVYHKLAEVPTATSATAGITKVYTDFGSNTDGTITQKAITDEISKKITASVDETEECLVFTAGI